MAELARVIDRLHVYPKFTTADVARLNGEFSGHKTADIVRAVLSEERLCRAAIVSSFGAESAVLVHLTGRVQPDIPVLFLDTGKHFPETLAYRDTLIAALGLTNVVTLIPDAAVLARRDETGLRWSYDPDGCCEIRKVQPLGRALAHYDATITGRKGFQSATRKGLPLFELKDERLTFNPLADWDKARIDTYMADHVLPAHPLVAAGYLSVGCAPCTSKVAPGEDPRAGRWRGWEKVECGIHTPVTMLDDPSIEPVF